MHVLSSAKLNLTSKTFLSYFSPLLLVVVCDRIYFHENFAANVLSNVMFKLRFSLTAGVSPSSSPPLTLTTDSYETYHPHEEPNRIMVNNLERPDYGPTGRNIPTSWSEVKSHSKTSGDYLSNKGFSHTNVTPRRERGTASRPALTSKSKISTYPEMVINGRNIEPGATTTGHPTTNDVDERTGIRNNIESSITPWERRQ